MTFYSLSLSTIVAAENQHYSVWVPGTDTSAPFTWFLSALAVSSRTCACQNSAEYITTDPLCSSEVFFLHSFLSPLLCLVNSGCLGLPGPQLQPLTAEGPHSDPPSCPVAGNSLRAVNWGAWEPLSIPSATHICFSSFKDRWFLLLDIRYLKNHF